MAVSSFQQVFELFKNLDHQFFEITVHTARIGEEKHPLFVQIRELSNNLRYRMIEFMASEEDENTEKKGFQISEDINAIMPLYNEWIVFLNKRLKIN
jgi:hypothetical protein